MFTRSDGKIALHHVGGATGTSLVGRFSAFDPKGAAFTLVKKLAEREEAMNPQVRFADLDQRSEAHADNINRRFLPYRHTIPVNVLTSSGRKVQIALRDLGLCIRNNELILVMRSTGQQVIPRLSSAYNFKRNELGVFRLLCNLQFQSVHTNLTLNVETLFPGLVYYPRIELQDGTVIAPARWYPPVNEITTLTRQPYSLGRLHLFLRKYGMPHRLLLGRGDQQLGFDLAHDREAFLFLNELQAAGPKLLIEYPLPDHSVQAEDGRLSAQFIAFGASREESFKYLPEKPLPENIERTILPGADFLYFKAYLTGRSANEFIAKTLIPLLDKFKGRIIKWFFIRYTDPQPHLRLRFWFTGSTIPGVFLKAFRRELDKSGVGHTLHGLTVDAYTREIERYGEQNMEIVESIFEAGSELVARNLALGVSGEAAVLDEPGMALWSAAQLVTQFFPDAESAGRFAFDRAADFFREHGAHKELKLSMDRIYRVKAKEVRQILSGNQGKLGELQAVYESRVGNLVTELGHLASPGQWFRLAADVCHMQMNRSFSEDQRKQEMLAWHCLAKHHRFLKSTREP
jgi:thiopeptide-type bacteriocin biosynthesis protein